MTPSTTAPHALSMTTEEPKRKTAPTPKVEPQPEAVEQPKPTVPFKFVQLFCRVMGCALFDMKVYGANNVPARGGVLLVSNHQSYLDPILIGIRVRRPLSYMAKSELFDVHPFFTWLIRSLGAFPVRQGAGDVRAVKGTIERLQGGHALNIYPEGSRTFDGEIGAMEKGVALVIRRARVPVVPVAIHGSFESWPRTAKMVRPHPIQLMYGKPVYLSDKRPEEILSFVDREVRRLYDELRQMHPSNYELAKAKRANAEKNQKLE